MAVPWLTFLLVMSLNYARTQAQFLCPPLGPILPAPTSLSDNPSLQQVIAQINLGLQNASSQLNETAVSVGVRSTHETQPLLSFHYTPESFNTSGTHNVTGDTVYLVGSATKLYTALAILQLRGAGDLNLSDPVTKYVPRLNSLPQNNNNLTTVDWSTVTIEALLDHLGGVPADYFFANIANRPPVYAPFTTPVYSNVGYALLGLVIENVSGKTYADYLQDNILQPSNMTRTFVGAPLNSSIGFIPIETNWWGTNLGFENSSGAISASNNDLLSFGTALLSAQLLSPEATRAWMKPKTFTPASGVSVGEVWEIARGPNLTSDVRTIDFYTKTGNLVDYTAVIALVPDYDLAFAINIAGPDSSLTAVQILLSAVATALVPAVDDVGKATAALQYSGTYVAANDSSISLAVDDGGLFVSQFTANGADVLVGYAALEDADTGNTSIRLYPTILRSGNESAWRAVYNPNSAEELAAVDAQLFFPQGSCQSWSGIDLITYGQQSLDYFVLTEDENGTIATVEPRAWRLVLNRAV
ncbi:hypothetical protein LTR10_017418 [Elasticomyces elasticus]|uniref:Beta-lactamase-related domain-containing protein n=1 Tax=Exophiala sideris TaxID=1016849 RepID=A0ABR0JAK0_9EURO|nr:hypothetical protein LTR10_017418 [Elasticomyces elasticus]KAK5030400.1 hypothetical protein LTS07_005184 [Exophiala sideris]KAK5038453.1 hypothetical protein LTR13_004200 [Exophiala sideris]KAK5060336.1 hypothetical protein LTR69_005653 [Exophiala sideris]KAK5183246.1 hypothetical protein LTR44_004247 [Eurotiomycetes sp. CCFEE 6388]